MASYKIVSFDKNAGSLIVKFAEDMAPLNVDVPLDTNNLFITGQELEQYIQGFIPTWHIERLEKLKNGIANASEIESLVSPEEVALPSISEMSDKEKANVQMWKQLEEEKTIARVLVKFGVLTEDPTVIPNTTL
jgi:hypothetical protein